MKMTKTVLELNGKFFKILKFELFLALQFVQQTVSNFQQTSETHVQSCRWPRLEKV